MKGLGSSTIVLTSMVSLATCEWCCAQLGCEVAHVAASDGGPFDSFGYAVAISGDIALVGAAFDNENGTEAGAVYAYGFDGAQWVQTQKLLALDASNGDYFGFSVAIDGEIAVIAALQHWHLVAPGTGAVYVFRFDPQSSQWLQEQELWAFDGEFGDGFGFSVSISGDVILIGAIGDDDNGVSSGSAYVFRFDANQSPNWSQEAKLLASDGSSSDGFGGAVAIEGDVAVIGASGYDGKVLHDNLGAVYVFRREPGTGRWVEEQRLAASDVEPQDGFGTAVAASQGVLLVGVENDDDHGSSSGSAYVFRYDTGTSAWVQEQKLLASDGAPNDLFGFSVALEGDSALIGAFADDDVGDAFGAAYVLRLLGGKWIEQQKLVPHPGEWTAFFGASVALSGDTGVVGAFGEDFQSGSAYFYAGLSGVDCNSNGRGDACDLLFGTSGDADGDGVPDECECPWDLDRSGLVGIKDLLALLGAWDTDPGGPPDFDADGAVGITDLLELLANWGRCS